MTPVQSIIVVVIRLWAAGSIISALTTIPYWFLNFLDDPSGNSQAMATYSAINAGVWFIAGLVAWILAPKLAAVTDKSNSHTVNMTIKVDTLVMAGSFLIGGFYFVQYAPELGAQFIIQFFEKSKDDLSQLQADRLGREHNENMTKSILIVIAALFMMLRPSMIAGIFSSLRHTGQHIDKEKEE